MEAKNRKQVLKVYLEQKIQVIIALVMLALLVID